MGDCCIKILRESFWVIIVDLVHPSECVVTGLKIESEGMPVNVVGLKVHQFNFPIHIEGKEPVLNIDPLSYSGLGFVPELNISIFDN